MKLDSFNRLPLDQKTSYMWDHGICLAQRIIENRYILCIFEVNGFFVEAIYSRRRRPNEYQHMLVIGCNLPTSLASRR